jgi:hypothetical protein
MGMELIQAQPSIESLLDQFPTIQAIVVHFPAKLQIKVKLMSTYKEQIISAWSRKGSITVIEFQFKRWSFWS